MQSLLDPAILFFVFGVLAGALKSNLEVPPAIAKFLSLYLLMALGLKGGHALSQTGVDGQVLAALGAAMAMAVLVPALGYQLLKRRVSGFDAAAVAASYGSVSAVTFVTALQVLESQGLQAPGHMTVAMVLMETPAIIMAVVLSRSSASRTTATGLPRNGGWVNTSTWTKGRVSAVTIVSRRTIGSAVAVPGPATAARRCARCCMSRSPTARTCCCWGPW